MATGEILPVRPITLTELEQVIERGLAAFVEVGNALLRIRDDRLYRETHATFEDYCRERWGLSRPHAYRLMDAAATTEALSPIGDTPRSESVARELAPLRSEPDVLREAWVETVERHGPKATAAQTREVVRLRQVPPIVPLEPRTRNGLSQAANSRLAAFHAMIEVIAAAPGGGLDHLGRDFSAAPAEWQAEIRRDCRKAARTLSRLGREL